MESGQFIDWAAGGTVPGAGLLTLRRLLETSVDTMLAIGGTKDALIAFSRSSWFERKDDMRVYNRPLKPWRRFQDGPKTPRELARFARDTYRIWYPNLAASAGWDCRPAGPSDPIFCPEPPAYASIVRTRLWFDYLTRCPALKTRLVTLERDGIPKGHAFLAFQGGRVQVSDFTLANDCPRADQIAAFSTVIRYVSADPDAIEIIAGSSVESVTAVLEATGLRLHSRVSVFLADPKRHFPPGTAIEVTPIIGDLFYV